MEAIIDLTKVDYLAVAKQHFKMAIDFPSQPEHADRAIAAALIAIAEGLRKE